jgi:hypothetical protein
MVAIPKNSTSYIFLVLAADRSKVRRVRVLAESGSADGYSEGKDSKRTKAISGFFSFVPVSYSLKTYQNSEKENRQAL